MAAPPVFTCSDCGREEQCVLVAVGMDEEPPVRCPYSTARKTCGWVRAEVPE